MYSKRHFISLKENNNNKQLKHANVNLSKTGIPKRLL